MLNNKILSLTLLILILVTFIIASRGASLSLLSGFLVLLFLLRKHIVKSQLYVFFTIIIIAFLLANLSQHFTHHLPQGFAERMVSLQDTTQAGSSRFIIWESLLHLFKEMPWYGLGLGSLWLFWPPYRPANDSSAGFFAHNDYMQLTLEAGYPAIILLMALFIFILIYFIRAFNNKTNKDNSGHTALSLTQRIELVSLFAALTTFAMHSIFTYNFYVFPLLLIAGVYLARLNQLSNLHLTSVKTIPALKLYFKPVMFIISLAGLFIILCSYFLGLSLSSYYNDQAKKLMVQKDYQTSNAYFLKAQKFAPLMDNPFFSHADLLRRGANKLLSINNDDQANDLLKLAHENLDKAEALNPMRTQTHHIRGLIYARNEPEKAIIEFEKALKLDPRFLFSRVQLAKLLYQQKQLPRAVQVLQNGIAYNYPGNEVAFEYLQLFATYSREAGAEGFASQLEKNMMKFIEKNSRPSSLTLPAKEPVR